MSRTRESGVNLDRLALLTVAGEVPQGVAKQLDTRVATGPGSAETAPKSGTAPQQVRIGDVGVKVVPDNGTDSLRVHRTGPNAERTARVATYSGHLITYTKDTAQKALDDQLADLRTQSATAARQIDTLINQIAVAHQNGPTSPC